MKIQKHFTAFVIILGVVLCGHFATSFAKLGVGVGNSKIEVTGKLTPGGIFELPSIPVLNTGDENAEYTMSVEFHEGQKEMMPKREWFSFSPGTFPLEPGQAKTIKVFLSLPVKTMPGEYFAYLEAHPLVKSVSGNTSVGIAAATKLYFTVSPSNIFMGILYKIWSFLVINSPWTWIIPSILLFMALIYIFVKNVKIEIRKSPEKKKILVKKTSKTKGNEKKKKTKRVSTKKISTKKTTNRKK